MLLLAIIVLVGLVAVLMLFGRSEELPAGKSRPDESDSEEWEYGDVWKQGSPEWPVPQDDVRYVEILRGDTGMGYDDSYLINLIGYLSSRGIRATYDAVPLAMEVGGAIKTYVLKVEAGREDEAIKYLGEKDASER
jgi:hypothetical protein